MSSFGKFFLPGPTEVKPEILATMTRPMISHRGSEIETMMTRIDERLQKVFRTTQPVFTVTSSATGLMEGGVRGGLAQNLATQLAHATLTGAAAMLSESGMSARELREMVTSPGGTTLAGLGALETHHFREAVIAAIDAATRRARELAVS